MSVELLGFNIDNYSFEEAVTKAKVLIDGDKVAQVVTINPEMFQTAENDYHFASIINEADKAFRKINRTTTVYLIPFGKWMFYRIF